MTDTCQRPGLVVTLLLRDRQLQWSADRSGMFLAMPRRGAEVAFLNNIPCCYLIMSGRNTAEEMYFKGHKGMAKVCCCGSAHHP